MKEEDIGFLNQLVLSIEQAGVLLEEGYNEKDSAKFQKAKKLILGLEMELGRKLDG